MPETMERPAVTLAMVDAWLTAMPEPDSSTALAVAASGVPFLVGRRGYARDSMGVPGKNDRGIFDDAIALVVGPTLWTFNANTDPSLARPGIAELVTGVYRYALGIHGLSKPVERQYPALVQAAPVTVQRDGGGRSSGYFGINIHRGGVNETTSEGCQTIWRPQWADFFARVKTAMQEANVTTIPYVLTARADA